MFWDLTTKIHFPIELQTLNSLLFKFISILKGKILHNYTAYLLTMD